MPKRTTREYRILLHNIRSAHNVGAMLRTADAAGVSKVYFSGYTPLPVDHFNRPNPHIVKTALGAEHSVPWERAKTFSKLISSLKKEGWIIIALEQAKHSKDYRTIPRNPKVLLVVGSEVSGMSKTLLKWADYVAEIPMHGAKESLNVSVALGIMLFRMID